MKEDTGLDILFAIFLLSGLALAWIFFGWKMPVILTLVVWGAWGLTNEDK